MTLLFRPARLDDVAALRKLENQVFSPADYPLSIRAFRYHIRSQNLLLVICYPTEIIGYVLVLLPKSRQTARLYSIAIAAEFRKQSFGKQLIAQVLASIIRLGFQRISLEVKVSNTGAIQFYHQIGFTVQHRLPHYYLDGTDGYKMLLDLAKQI